MNKAVAEHISEDSLPFYDLSEQRYTSYPAKERFVEAFSADDYTQVLQLRRLGSGMTLPFSMDIHIPYCESLGYCSACKQVVTGLHEGASSYLDNLHREIDLHTEHLGVGQALNQLHVGGVTSTFLSEDQLRSLLNKLHRSFSLSPSGDFSIEIDPRAMNAVRLDLLAELGFNRLSFCVQDIDFGVQKAVSRFYPAELLFDLFKAARQRGFGCINLDLLFGLPQQSPDSFECTLTQLLELRPERITLHAYAHQLDRFKPQKRIVSTELPEDTDQVAMLSRSIAALIKTGYVHVGLNHFALSTDPLATAKWQGRLHRNSQGYSTQPECDVIGLGASSISRIGATYRQNARTLADYSDRLDQGLFPVERGLGLSRDDLVRRAVIMSLMCHGEILYESIELAYLIDFRRYFASEMVALQALQGQGLVTQDNDGIQVSSTGCYFVQRVAMVFDRYLQADRVRARFSRII